MKLTLAALLRIEAKRRASISPNCAACCSIILQPITWRLTTSSQCHRASSRGASRHVPLSFGASASCGPARIATRHRRGAKQVHRWPLHGPTGLAGGDS